MIEYACAHIVCILCFMVSHSAIIFSGVCVVVFDAKMGILFDPLLDSHFPLKCYLEH